jgi:predicted ATPase
MNNTMNESAARTMLLTAMRDASNYLLNDANRRLASTDDANLAFDSYTDNDDYSPAAANLLATLTATIYNTDTFDSALARLDSLLNDSNFIDDAETCDFMTPLFDYIDSFDN